MTPLRFLLALAVIFLAALGVAALSGSGDWRAVIGLGVVFMLIFVAVGLGILMMDKSDGRPSWQLALQKKSRPFLRILPYVFYSVLAYWAYRFMVFLEWDWGVMAIIALVLAIIGVIHVFFEFIFDKIGTFLWRFKTMQWVLTGLLAIFTISMLAMALFEVFSLPL